MVVAFTNTITKQYTWLVVLSGLAVSVPFAMAYVALARKFPGKDLVQINHIIYGPYLGKLVSATGSRIGRNISQGRKSSG